MKSDKFIGEKVVQNKMLVLPGSRGSGKTTALIKRCSELGGCIVCHNTSECRRIVLIAQKMYLKEEIRSLVCKPITYSQFLSPGFCPSEIKCFHIDNVDMLLGFMSKVPVLTATINI